jgi:hypothetical protein
MLEVPFMTPLRLHYTQKHPVCQQKIASSKISSKFHRHAQQSLPPQNAKTARLPKSNLAVYPY